MSVFVGHVLITLLMWIAALALLPLYDFGIAFLLAFFGIGITQLLYVIPLALWLKRRGRVDTMKGVILGAAITVLLNGSCFVLMTQL